MPQSGTKVAGKPRPRRFVFMCTDKACRGIQWAVKDAKPVCYLYSAEGHPMRRLSTEEVNALKCKGPGLN